MAHFQKEYRFFMKEEHRKYAEEVYDIINHAAKNIGARLPGSDGEKKFAAYMGDKLREIGIEPVREEFAVSPRASIGGIPYAGWLGLALSPCLYRNGHPRSLVRHGSRFGGMHRLACLQRFPL